MTLEDWYRYFFVYDTEPREVVSRDQIINLFSSAKKYPHLRSLLLGLNREWLDDILFSNEKDKLQKANIKKYKLPQFAILKNSFEQNIAHYGLSPWERLEEEKIDQLINFPLILASSKKYRSQFCLENYKNLYDFLDVMYTLYDDKVFNPHRVQEVTKAFYHLWVFYGDLEPRFIIGKLSSYLEEAGFSDKAHPLRLGLFQTLKKDESQAIDLATLRHYISMYGLHNAWIKYNPWLSSLIKPNHPQKKIFSIFDEQRLHVEKYQCVLVRGLENNAQIESMFYETYDPLLLSEYGRDLLQFVINSEQHSFFAIIRPFESSFELFSQGIFYLKDQHLHILSWRNKSLNYDQWVLELLTGLAEQFIARMSTIKQKAEVILYKSSLSTIPCEYFHNKKNIFTIKELSFHEYSKDFYRFLKNPTEELSNEASTSFYSSVESRFFKSAFLKLEDENRLMLRSNHFSL